MRIGRVQNLTDQHSRKRKVVGVLALSGGLARGVNEGDALTDDREFRHFNLPSHHRDTEAQSMTQFCFSLCLCVSVVNIIFLPQVLFVPLQSPILSPGTSACTRCSGTGSRSTHRVSLHRWAQDCAPAAPSPS